MRNEILEQNKDFVAIELTQNQKTIIDAEVITEGTGNA